MDEPIKNAGELEVAGELVPVTFEFVIKTSIETMGSTVDVRKRSLGRVVANDGRTLPRGEHPLHYSAGNEEEHLIVNHVGADKWEIVFDTI